MFIIIWLLLLIGGLYYSVNFILDGKLNVAILDKVSNKDKVNTIEIKDIEMVLEGGRYGKAGVVLEIEDNNLSVQELDFIVKNEILNISSDIKDQNLKELQQIYETSIKDKLKTYGVMVKGLYITEWIVV